MNWLPVQFIKSVGDSVLIKSTNIVSMLDLFGAAIGALLNPGKVAKIARAGQISRQILFTGVEALFLVSLIAFIAGSTIVMQATATMPKFGVSDYFGKILVMVVVRELGPFFTALVVIGRSGSALAAHIGNMRVNKEIAALEVMGINPVSFLVVPALAGMVASIICLNFYFDAVAIIGGLLVAKLTSANVSFLISIEKVFEALSVLDIIISVIKGVAFGSIIGVVSCHYGLQVATIRGVPQAAIKSVVGSMAGTIAVTILVTMCMVALGLYAL